MERTTPSPNEHANEDLTPPNTPGDIAKNRLPDTTPPENANLSQRKARRAIRSVENLNHRHNTGQRETQVNTDDKERHGQKTTTLGGNTTDISPGPSQLKFFDEDEERWVEMGNKN